MSEQRSVGDLIKAWRRQTGHLPRRQRELVQETIAALTQISVRLHQATAEPSLIAKPTAADVARVNA